MQLREDKAVTREPKDWSGRFPIPLLRFEPPVTITARFQSIGTKFPYTSLGHIPPHFAHTTSTHQSSRLFSRICCGVLLFILTVLIPYLVSFFVTILHA